MLVLWPMTSKPVQPVPDVCFHWFMSMFMDVQAVLDISIFLHDKFICVQAVSDICFMAGGTPFTWFWPLPASFATTVWSCTPHANIHACICKWHCFFCILEASNLVCLLLICYVCGDNCSFNCYSLLHNLLVWNIVFTTDYVGFSLSVRLLSYLWLLYFLVVFLRKYQLWLSQNFQDSAKLVLLCVQNPWLEFVDFEQAQYEISCTAATWRSVVSGRPQMEAPLHRRRRLSEQSGKCWTHLHTCVLV